MIFRLLANHMPELDDAALNSGNVERRSDEIHIYADM